MKYSNVKAVEIYNNSKNIRVGFNDTTTADTDNYWIIPSSAVGFERANLNLDTLIIRLKGDTSSDTAGNLTGKALGIFLLKAFLILGCVIGGVVGVIALLIRRGGA